MEHEPTMQQQQQQQKLQIESSFVIPHESVSRNSQGLECKAAVFWLLKQPFFLVPPNSTQFLHILDYFLGGFAGSRFVFLCCCKSS